LKFIKEKYVNTHSKYKNPKTITPTFKGREEKIYNRFATKIRVVIFIRIIFKISIKNYRKNYSNSDIVNYKWNESGYTIRSS
jgi:hypothetical protein